MSTAPKTPPPANAPVPVGELVVMLERAISEAWDALRTVRKRRENRPPPEGDEHGTMEKDA